MASESKDTTQDWREERDSMGPIPVPADRLWGAQTERARGHFAISVERMPIELVHALAELKRAAALANAELGLTDPEVARAIASAADEVLAGRWDDEFPLSVWQTGSGTQTNMNVNEVLANRASELLGGMRGEGRRVHPNDDVNRGQSSNDAVPAALHLTAARSVARFLLPSLEALRAAIEAQAARHAGLVKLGRTHLQDALPVTFGQELSGHAAQLSACGRALEAALPALCELPVGATAVGTGVNAAPGFAQAVVQRLAERTGLPLTTAANNFAALAGHDALLVAHGAMNALAMALFKIANDLRWMGSGPRGGLGEIALPENEPGSSIMPGKVNPTQSEAIMMVACGVAGNQQAISMATAGLGNFELNVSRPLVADAFLRSARTLSDAMRQFRLHCVEGMEPIAGRMRALVDDSLMLVTALAPRIGYDRAAKIAQRAHREGLSLRQAAIDSGAIDAPGYDAAIDLDALTGRKQP